MHAVLTDAILIKDTAHHLQLSLSLLFRLSWKDALTSRYFLSVKDFTLRIQIFIKLLSIKSYFPEVRAFGTLIMSAEVFRLIFSPK